LSPTGLILKGTATASSVGSVDAGVTSHNLSPAIDVVAGQLIEVELTYTFAAGATTVAP
jgi:hypothetical protein